MKYIISVVLLFFLFPTCVSAQRDTVYVDGFFQPCKKASALYYRFLSAPEFGRCKVEVYTLSGQLYKVFYVSAKDSATYDGSYIAYHENGQKAVTGSYINGIKTGIWKIRFEDTNSVWRMSEYLMEGDTFEISITYYRNGKVKRIEYTGKNIDTGVRYSLTGEILPFTRFEIMPRPKYDWQQFVANNLKYPLSARDDNMQGRVYVQFVVQKNGVISKIIAMNDRETPLAKEAVRVVSIMPDWEPGIQDDETVDVYFTLPVTFRLE